MAIKLMFELIVGRVVSKCKSVCLELLGGRLVEPVWLLDMPGWHVWLVAWATLVEFILNLSIPAEAKTKILKATTIMHNAREKIHFTSTHVTK